MEWDEEKLEVGVKEAGMQGDNGERDTCTKGDREGRRHAGGKLLSAGCHGNMSYCAVLLFIYRLCSDKQQTNRVTRSPQSISILLVCV